MPRPKMILNGMNLFGTTNLSQAVPSYMLLSIYDVGVNSVKNTKVKLFNNNRAKVIYKFVPLV